MSNNTTKFGWLTYENALKRIEEGKLDVYDTVFCTDKESFYVVDEELKLRPSRSRIHVFESEEEANTKLNENLDTYEGQPVAVKSDDTMLAFIVCKNENGFYVSPLGSSNVSWNNLQDRPFYEKDPVEAIKYDINEILTSSGGSWDTQTVSGVTLYMTGCELPTTFQVGDEISLLIDGTKYIYTLEDLSETFGEGYFGCGDIDDFINEDVTNLDFVLIGANSSNNDTSTIQILIQSDTAPTVCGILGTVIEIVKLDEKFLPGDYVESVNGIVPDENGNITLDNTSLGAAKVVTVTVIDEVASMSATEVENAYNVGNVVLLEYNNELYNLVGFNLNQSSGCYFVHVQKMSDYDKPYVKFIRLLGNSISYDEWYPDYSTGTYNRGMIELAKANDGTWSCNKTVDEIDDLIDDKDLFACITISQLDIEYIGELTKGSSSWIYLHYVSLGQPTLESASEDCTYIFSGVYGKYTITASISSSGIDVKAEMITQSDWNQNDEEQQNHVLNRTHYVKDEEYVSQYTTSVATTELSDSTNYKYIRFDELYYKYPFEEGAQYKVIINDTEYEEIAVMDSKNYEPYIGNYYIKDSSQEDTGQNFLLYSGYLYVPLDTTIETYNLEIQKFMAEVIVLDEKYISYKPGLKVAGKLFDVDGADTYGRQGAEIFNDYENNIAIGLNSKASGWNTMAIGAGSSAEGYNTKVYGQNAHVEGSTNTVYGNGAHAEGSNNTINNANFAHAEGKDNVIEDMSTGAHAEGCKNTVLGYYAHSEGLGTYAKGKSQHVQGEYNIIDETATTALKRGRYAYIIGNGTSDSDRSNAHTVDWEGNGWYQGSLYVGGTSQDDEAAQKVATINDIINTQYHQILMKDSVNGFDYIVEMQDGVLVSFAKCVSITVTQNPDNMTIVSGGEFDPTGMIVIATMQDGETREIENYAYELVDNIVTISYVELGVTYTTTLEVTVETTTETTE